MVRFSGAKLAYLLSRRSLGSRAGNYAPNALGNSLKRGFFSGVYNSPRILQYVVFEDVKQSNVTWSGALHGSLVAVRSIHATGIDDNEVIKMSRGGGTNPDGNQPGDLYVAVKVKEDCVFRRKGADIHVDAVLSVTQAILGGTARVPTLTGDVEILGLLDIWRLRKLFLL